MVMVIGVEMGMEMELMNGKLPLALSFDLCLEFSGLFLASVVLAMIAES